MNNVKIESEQQGTQLETVALVDCGKVSEVTKGSPFLIFWEFCPPPADTALM